MKRRTYGSSMLDAVVTGVEGEYDLLDPNLDLFPADEGSGEHKLISSRLFTDTEERQRHLPVLDIDFEARLVPSSTPGHYHLYLDGMPPLSWERYEKLLEALADAGVIEEGYYYAAKMRKHTMVRRPGLKKKIKEVNKF